MSRSENRPALRLHAYRPDEAPADEPGSQQAPERDAAEVGRLLLQLARTHSTITIFTGDEEGGYTHLEAVERSGRERVTSHLRDSVLGVLQAATGGEPRKVCPRCDTEKRLDQFPRDASRPDGRFSYCDECNRANVRRYARRRAA